MNNRPLILHPPQGTRVCIVLLSSTFIVASMLFADLLSIGFK
jgi:hypothetical protein